MESSEMVKVACGRCGGSGRYSWNRRDGSRCYGCDGRGHAMVSAAEAAKKQRRREQAERRRVRDAAKAASLMSEAVSYLLRAETRRLADLFHVRGIDEELHGLTSWDS